MIRNTHTTAVVIIQTIELWEPIQAIWKIHDRHFRQWMPHITMLGFS
jgi:hypothetical protein